MVESFILASAVLFILNPEAGMKSGFFKSFIAKPELHKEKKKQTDRRRSSTHCFSSPHGHDV